MYKASRNLFWLDLWPRRNHCFEESPTTGKFLALSSFLPLILDLKGLYKKVGNL
jgi:hypothetical protein